MTGKKPPFLRRRLGRRLRTMREEAQLTMDEAAKLLDKTRSALHRMESGENRVDVHVVRSMMDVYDHFDAELVNQVRAAMKPPWFRAYGVADAGYVDVETEAIRVREFAGLNLPGLLQTEQYMHALLQSGGRRTAQELNNDVKVRLIRQQRLASASDPLELAVIIDEAALRRDIGGAQVMREQLEHLVEVAALPSVTVQVVPLGSGSHSAMSGGFTLLSFADPEDLEMLYVSYVTGALHIENAEELRRARLVFDSLRSEALTPSATSALITELARR